MNRDESNGCVAGFLGWHFTGVKKNSDTRARYRSGAFFIGFSFYVAKPVSYTPDPGMIVRCC
jgi:hypothetical protein